MSAFALLTALLFHMPAYADAPVQEQNCVVDTELVGDAMLLFRNAADSWKAETTLTCDTLVFDEATQTMRPTWRFTKPITISFIGNTTNYENVNARVRMQMEIKTARKPSDFELTRVPVFFALKDHALDSGPLKVGDFTKFNITITGEDPSSKACMSLASGTLFLRNRSYEAADASFTNPDAK